MKHKQLKKIPLIFDNGRQYYKIFSSLNEIEAKRNKKLNEI